MGRANHQYVEVAHVIEEALDFLYFDFALLEVLTAHFHHGRDVEGAARDHRGFDAEFAEPLFEFGELADAARVAPEGGRLQIDETVFVVDGHAVWTVGRQGVHDERTLGAGQHLFGDRDVGAEGIPAGGEVGDVIVVTRYAQVVERPALVSDPVGLSRGIEGRRLYRRNRIHFHPHQSGVLFSGSRSK